MPTQTFATCSCADAWNFQGATNQPSTQPESFHQPGAPVLINQQQLWQSIITQRSLLETHQQLLSYNHQPAIGTPPITQFLPHSFSNSFGCHPQLLQPSIKQQTTCCQPTQQFPHHLTTRQPLTFHQHCDTPAIYPTAMLATTRQPDAHHQPTISKV